MTSRGNGGIMDSQDCVTVTPTLSYEDSTGYIVLRNGRLRQVVARTDGIDLYLFCKSTKNEYKLTPERLMGLMQEARGE